MANTFSPELFRDLAKAGIKERLTPEILSEGIAHAEELIACVRERRYPRVQGIGDDFIPDTAGYNALGAIYSELPQELREKALRAYLSQMDGVNYMRVQMNHTPGIYDPAVLSDLGTVRRGLYWPGLRSYEDFLVRAPDFAHFSDGWMDSNGLFVHAPKHTEVSDFLFAYAALRKDISAFGDDFARVCHPGFLDRVVEGIVNMRFAGVETPEEIGKGRERLRTILSEGIQDLVDKKYADRKWMNPEFR